MPDLEQTLERTAELFSEIVDKVRVLEKAITALESQMHAQGELVLTLQQECARHRQMEKITERHLNRIHGMVWKGNP